MADWPAGTVFADVQGKYTVTGVFGGPSYYLELGEGKRVTVDADLYAYINIGYTVAVLKPNVKYGRFLPVYLGMGNPLRYPVVEKLDNSILRTFGPNVRVSEDDYATYHVGEMIPLDYIDGEWMLWKEERYIK